MPQQFIDDPNVALKWKLYGYLNGFWIAGKTVYARNDTLAKQFNKTERAVQHALGELQEMGLITRDIQGLSRYILPGGITEGRSPASPLHEAQLHPRDEAQLHHISDSIISDSNLADEASALVEVVLEDYEKPLKRESRVKDKLAVYHLFSSKEQPWWRHAQQKRAALTLFDLVGMEKLRAGVQFMRENSHDKYCPQADTPFEYEEQMPALARYVKRKGL